MKRSKKNFLIYGSMMLLFGTLIYLAIHTGETFDHSKSTAVGHGSSPWSLFQHILSDNLSNPVSILLLQIIVILIVVRIVSALFKYIGQPGVIGEIIAGIALGPSLLGYFWPEAFQFLFPAESLTNLNLLSQIGLVLFMFIIGMELDFGVLKQKLHETLVISHAGIIVPFFLGIATSIWAYEEYASHQTAFLPFALFIGISMSITAFPVLARIIQERNMTKTPLGVLAIASAANDDITAWCLLAVVIAIAKAGSIVSALFTIGLALVYMTFMFVVVRPFLRKVGNVYANSEVINKSFISFIFLTLILSAVTTEIIGIHALFGAFLAGVVMPVNTGFRKVMMEKIEDIALVFFLPLFFVYTGLRTEIGLLNTPELWMVCAVFIFVAVLGKLGGCALAARLVGESTGDSLKIGTLMNTRGLMELVALNIGYEMGVLPPEVFVMLILMALITTFMTTPLLSAVQHLFDKNQKRTYPKKNILLSFGQAESGRSLLYMARLLLGHRLKDFRVIASHFTLGSDVNPIKAAQFRKESFQPIKQEAARLRIHIEKRYKVTDKLATEIIRSVRKEEIDFLFVGAGIQFMQNRKGQPAGFNIPKLFQFIKSPSCYLPGRLFQEKLESIIEQTDCNTVIFVNRNFSHHSRQVSIFVDQAEDLFLLDFVGNLLENREKKIRIYASGDFYRTILHKDETFLTLNEQYPERVTIETFDREEQLRFYEQELMLMSYRTCLYLSQIERLFSRLPSMLIVKPTDKSNEAVTPVSAAPVDASMLRHSNNRHN